jgi:hypothetical protein
MSEKQTITDKEYKKLMKYLYPKTRKNYDKL